MKIKFGTDGWRAIMAEDFTFENVEKVVQAVALYVKTLPKCKNGVVIGYDNRFLSEKFAARCAEVLAGNDINVLFYEKAVPTPVTAFATVVLKAAGALMLTASHNPPEYNGIKFIPEYGGPALPDVTDKIEAYLSEVDAGREKIYKHSLKHAKELGLYEEINIDETYITHLLNNIASQEFKNVNLKVVIDPMYGAGIGYLEDIFTRLNMPFSVLENWRDPLFGGKMPEPSAAVLTELREVVLAENADLGLALDGDADRFGIIDSDGSFITPNEVLYLLYHHLLTYRKMHGPVARSVATTHLLDKIAERHNLKAEETPVGFKYIGQCLLKGTCILGGEESGGLSVSWHIPEKDGILAALLVSEIRAVNNKPLRTILAEQNAIYGAMVSTRLDVHVDPEQKIKIISKLENFVPESIAGKRVVQVNKIDGVKISLEDGSWLLIRASGTEPLFRLYVEAADEASLNSIQLDAKQILSEH